MRHIQYQYQDPLTLIWLHTLEQMEWTLERSHDVFASWDGQGTLTLGYEHDLDPDDHLAQMVLHEVCHACIEGPQSWTLIDWGLYNFDHRDLHREYACHHLQAYLADQVGLRTFFAPTTQWREYYDQLQSNPLQTGEAHIRLLAQQGWQCLQKSSWYTPIKKALLATQQIQHILRQNCRSDQDLSERPPYEESAFLSRLRKDTLWLQDEPIEDTKSSSN